MPSTTHLLLSSTPYQIIHGSIGCIICPNTLDPFRLVNFLVSDHFNFWISMFCPWRPSLSFLLFIFWSGLFMAFWIPLGEKVPSGGFLHFLFKIWFFDFTWHTYLKRSYSWQKLHQKEYFHNWYFAHRPKILALELLRLVMVCSDPYFHRLWHRLPKFICLVSFSILT